MAAVTDGSAYGLWASPDGDGWHAVAAPPDVPHNPADQTMSVASDGTSVVVLADDGESARLWLAPVDALG